MIRKMHALNADPINIVDKGWGKEEWYLNKELCIKSMWVEPGRMCSFHFHSNKYEIFLITSGMMELQYIDVEDGSRHFVWAKDGDWIEIEKNTPHRFIGGPTGCAFFEFSTHHEDEDSYRVEPGDSQK